jgi:amidase
MTNIFTLDALLRPFIYSALICIFLSGLLYCQPRLNESADAADDHFMFEEYGILQFHEGYTAGKFTVSEVVESYLNRINTIDAAGYKLNAIIAINPDALVIALKLDEELKQGQIRGLMHGIPVILKDNIDTHDKMPTTAGSRALKGSFPLQDSWVARKLRDAGAVIIAKANLSEWANFRSSYSSSGWSGLGGQTKNPYDLSRNPCGSSSGSAVAVSANLCVVAIGTETNGSIVCPSNSNGIVGIKPTVGLISRSGIVPISFTQDTPGPMARSVEDAVICLGSLTGIDPEDTKTLASKGNSYMDYTGFLDSLGLRGKRLGLYTNPLGKNHKVDELIRQAVTFLEGEGAEVIEIDKLIRKKVRDLSFDVMLYEFKDGLNKYLSSLGENAPLKSLEALIEFNKWDSIELKYFDQKILEMAQRKGNLDDSKYRKALEEMQRLSREEGIDKVMDEYSLNAIIAPTGGPAWKTDLLTGDHFSLGSSSPAAISGYPSITVPMGFIGELPVNISFFGRAWSEPDLIEIAYAFEQGTKHRKPPKFISTTEYE